MLDITEWYAVGIACVPAILVLVCLYLILRWIYQFARFFILRYMVYPILILRERSGAVTRLQFFLLFLFLAGNGVAMALYVKGAREESNRAAIMASINLVPLFCGGRTSILADQLGIPLHSYYFAHHWIGRVVVVQGLLHAGLAWFTASASKKTDLLPSGIPLSVALASIGLLSLSPVRRFNYEIFLKLHFLLFFAFTAALILHLRSLNMLRFIYPWIAISLWSSNFIFRSLKWLRCNRGKRLLHQQVRITKCYYSGNDVHRKVGALKLEVDLLHPMTIKPGQYLYLRTTDLQVRYLFQSHPFVIMWWEEAAKRVPSKFFKNVIVRKESKRASRLTFLIEPRDGITAKLMNQTFLSNLTLDGPYGQDYQLQNYDTVILAARGVGIAAILGYAKQLMWSAGIDRHSVLTRKLDIYWELDNNGQERWIGEYLKELQNKNATLSSPILQIWCYFPNILTTPPVLRLKENNADFVYILPPVPEIMRIDNAIGRVTRNAPGTSIVVACGIPQFTQKIRATTLREMSTNNVIEFVEAEYRPLARPLHVLEPRLDVEMRDVGTGRKPMTNPPSKSRTSQFAEFEDTEEEIPIRSFV